MQGELVKFEYIIEKNNKAVLHSFHRSSALWRNLIALEHKQIKYEYKYVCWKRSSSIKIYILN